jgi:hypothetical protein
MLAISNTRTKRAVDIDLHNFAFPRFDFLNGETNFMSQLHIVWKFYFRLQKKL